MRATQPSTLTVREQLRQYVEGGCPLYRVWVSRGYVAIVMIVIAFKTVFSKFDYEILRKCYFFWNFEREVGYGAS